MTPQEKRLVRAWTIAINRQKARNKAGKPTWKHQSAMGQKYTAFACSELGRKILIYVAKDNPEWWKEHQATIDYVKANQ